MTFGTRLSAPPLFSIVTPVYDPPVEILRETIESVQEQTWDDWEWILVDDCSPTEAVRTELRRAAASDPRIRVIERSVNGHIVEASNEALDAATGTFVVLLDHDDLLVPHALDSVKGIVKAYEDVDYVYSDEDKIDEEGNHYDLFLKPDWSPERLRGQMYVNHLSVFRRELVMSVGGFRAGFEGSQDHDLVLRVTEQARRIEHIPDVLYHWRVLQGSTAGDVTAKPYATEAGRRAVQESLARLGIAGSVVRAPGTWGHFHVWRELPADRRVSIVIPTAGTEGVVWGSRRRFVVEALRGALARTQHPNLEVVVVYDPSTPADVLTDLRSICGDQLVLVPFSGPFNFSEKMNVGVVHSTGDRLVFLNDDVDVISDGWLEQLVGPLEEPDVGMTGAKLYFSDSTIQHAGHRYQGNQYVHAFLGAARSEPGVMAQLLISREVSGVTAACSAMRREDFDNVGGFCEELPINFNDVDLCYKVTTLGLRIVWMAQVELFHFESRSRTPGVESWEHLRAMDRWGSSAEDRYIRG